MGDMLLWIGGTDLGEGDYSGYIKALRGLSDRIGKPVDVRWVAKADGRTHVAEAVVR